jgi:Ca2+-binding EF-hand superfamily protein
MTLATLTSLAPLPSLCAETAPSPGATSAAPEKKGEEQKRKKALDRFDKNKDGQLDEMEKAEMKQAMQGKAAEFTKKHPEAIKKFDTDGDGKLNEGEFKAAREGHRQEMLKKFDANKDGKLDSTEKAKLRESRPTPPKA